MKDTLQEIFNQFGQSKAVFIGQHQERGRTLYGGNNGDIVFTVKEEYDVRTASVNFSDPVVELLAHQYREHFNKEQRCWEKATSGIEQTHRQIFMSIKSTLLHASPLKNPEQSKLYKWFGSSIMDTQIRREGLIALYRYICKHADDDFRFKEGSENPHAKNVIAILEKMREKYEQK